MRIFAKKGIALILTSAVLFTSCAGEVRKEGADTPKEAAEQVMSSVKELDLETFNAYTDNYEGACLKLFGFAVEKEYKVFQDLLNPHVFESRRYKEKRRFAKKVVENLTWEIDGVREEDGGKKASVRIKLTNKDMAEAVERYILWIVENTVNETGLGAAFVIKNISKVVNECDDDLIRFIDETEHTWTEDITVTAYKEDGVWKLHLTDEFINAFMGNIDSEEYEDGIN